MNELKLPEPDTHCLDDEGGRPIDVWSYSPELVRLIVAADRALREQAQPERKPLSETDLLGLRWDAKCRWNSQADAYNAWDELGQDEQDLLVGREVERFHGIEE